MLRINTLLFYSPVHLLTPRTDISDICQLWNDSSTGYYIVGGRAGESWLQIRNEEEPTRVAADEKQNQRAGPDGLLLCSLNGTMCFIKGEMDAAHTDVSTAAPNHPAARSAAVFGPLGVFGIPEVTCRVVAAAHALVNDQTKENNAHIPSAPARLSCTQMIIVKINQPVFRTTGVSVERRLRVSPLNLNVPRKVKEAGWIFN